MLRVAAAFIEENCPDRLIDYDETTCDGSCLAEDLRACVEEDDE
jgi:hypothetical protein